ncbi:Mitochondrial distribution and morphology protein 12 [Mortierella hygrophila]|uniref:Mitochondrial distribution and morphology protein 12 n=1 Tax=Mortierella hygrophila TaxID=979708 RepID=A0A9P6K6K6_9FUNG|nr:Mitochondrial distribution and morphology protein 12 [Mortierella hygrophila]
MSFVFEWDKLDDEVALQIEGMIHAHFQRIPKPAFMGNIAVSKFRFGSTPPNITVLDVTDPLEEWYVHMDQEEARLAQEAAEGGGGESMDEDELASGEEYDDEYSYSEDGSIVMVGEGDDIEYLRSGSYEEDEQLETEAWMRRSRRQEGSGSDHEYYTSTRDHNQHFKSALASPTRISPSSSASSSGSGQSRRPSAARDHPPLAGNRYNGDNKEINAPSTTTNRSDRNPKLGIDTSLGSPGHARSSSSTQHNPISTKKPATTHSLSSHASDDEIESEAFYTQGESTIYQRMKNLVLEPSSFLSSRPASVEGESSDDQPLLKPATTQQTTLGAPLFTTTPGGPNGNTNNGLGFGFNAGIGSSPGSVISSVMQTRSNTRPLSSASFYSTPPAAATAAGAATSHASTAQHPQLYFPDLSGMVVSGNSLLGLRAGTPSRTIPSTPRGFESPTLAFSRRQSFSDNDSNDPAANSTSNRYSAPVPIPSQSGSDHHHQQTTEYMSPVEALSFDAFSRQPKVVERLKDEEDAHPPRSRSAPSYNGDHQSQRQANPRSRPDRGEQQLQADGRRRRKRNQGDSYHRSGPSFPPSPIPVSRRHENDIQMLLAVHYQGQMGFTVETELLLNYPTYAFLTLPVKLVITGFSFKTKMLMGYLRDHVNVSFLEPEDPNESILSNVRIESQVGDEQKQGKVERFVVEQLRKFITEDFVYPSYHSVELVRAPAPAPPPTAAAAAQPTDAAARSAQTLNTARSAGRDRSSSSSGVSPAASNKDQSEALEDGEKGEEEEEELSALAALQGQQPLLLVCMRLRRFELDQEPLQLTVVISFLKKGKQIITVVGLCNPMTS